MSWLSRSRLDHSRAVGAGGPDGEVLLFDIRRSGKKLSVIDFAAYHMHES